jgi:CRP/FNR family cyclic AMP-dependent transcriptional regulator
MPMARKAHGRTTFDFHAVSSGRGAGESRLRFKSGDVIYAQGDTPDALFYVEQGHIKIAVVAHNGKEVVLSLRGAAEFFGEGCLLKRHQRLATVTALTDCTVVRITKAAMIRMVREEPGFAETFIVYLIHRHVRSQTRIADQLIHSAERRLAQTLLQLAETSNGSTAGLSPISNRVSQTILASMVGTTRSRVNFFMNRFKRQGLIDYDRSGFVSVRDAALRRLVRSET